MKDKFIKFMQGRYGVDQFAKFTMGVALVSIILAIFVKPGSASLIRPILVLILTLTALRVVTAARNGLILHPLTGMWTVFVKCL